MKNVLCDVRKTFVYNDKLECLAKNNPKLVEQLVLIGRKFSDFVYSLKSGTLMFPTEDPGNIMDYVNNYKTFFGPVYYCGAVCYAKESLSNLSKALTRVTCSREPDIPGFSLDMERNQMYSFDMSGSTVWHTVWRNYFSWLKSRCFCPVQELGEHFDVIKTDSERLHPKRKLRMQAYQELIDKGTLLTMDYLRSIGGKLKCPEWAKPGKFPRLVGDYTCPGSLLGGAVCACIKHVFEEWYVIKDLQMRFVFTPDYNTLKDCYSRLLTEGVFTFIYHSDDACASIPCLDKQVYVNIDISSCDASNGVSVFKFVSNLVKDTYWGRVVDLCIKQCEKPLKIFNPRNPREKVKLTNVGGPIEYSGTVLTTLLNNVATSAICLSIYVNCRNVHSRNISSSIAKAAAAVGYKVTVEVAEVFEDVQFLKTSPTRCSNDVSVFLNFGVILRSYGSCNGDLPGRGSIAQRGYLRNCEITQGMCHAGDSSIMRILRTRFPKRQGKENIHWLVDNMRDRKSVV